MKNYKIKKSKKRIFTVFDRDAPLKGVYGLQRYIGSRMEQFLLTNEN